MKYEEQVERLRDEWKEELAAESSREIRRDKHRPAVRKYREKNSERLRKYREEYERRAKADEENAVLSWRLRMYRAEKGLTQEELGGMLGVSSSTICRWEAGSRPVQMKKLEQAGVIIC